MTDAEVTQPRHTAACTHAYTHLHAAHDALGVHYEGAAEGDAAVAVGGVLAQHAESAAHVAREVGDERDLHLAETACTSRGAAK